MFSSFFHSERQKKLSPCSGHARETEREEHPNADLLKDKYGIKEPIAPEDSEHATLALAVMALNY